ncbi:MAG: TIM barrel protein [Rhodothermaceae bacterium]|nr:TIM barrel protein [Rhodothermaceae bacterium]
MRSTRRQFLRLSLGELLTSIRQWGSSLKFGLVTYLWGRDWDIPTLIHNCEVAGAGGVELRTEHAHGVEVHLRPAERAAVSAQFADSDVLLLGLGTNWAFHHRDPARLAHEITAAKASIVLSHDVGGSGVKVKPDALPHDVDEAQTIAQIGRALRILGQYGEDYGQEIRLEVHGQGTDRLPVVRRIMEAADHRNVKVCWNCNEADLNDPGLAHNFGLVREFFGQTVHIRELDVGTYPYRQLFELLQVSEYEGWILLEARTEPDDRVAALGHQRLLFDSLVELTKKSG